MDKIWLKSYPSGIPADIDFSECPSLTHLIKDACLEYVDRPAIENMGTRFTYGEFLEKSNHLAAYFQKKLKLKKGDRFAIMLPNILQYPITLFAALQVGLVIVNLNPLFTERELLLPLKDSGAKAILVLANFADTLQTIIQETEIKHVIVTEIGDEFPSARRLLINSYLRYIKKAVPTLGELKFITYRKAMREGQREPFEEVETRPEDIAFLQYTGGTTGSPKGAILTHRNMVSNIMQCIAWINDDLENGKEVVITALPLYHIFSLTICCLTFIKLGGLSVLITNPRDIKGFIKKLSKVPFTVFVGVNTLYQAILQHSSFNILDFSRLKLALAGGMPVMKPVADNWNAKTKKNIIMGYGLTEASPVVTINPLRSNYTGSIGLPIPATEVRVVDNNGKDVVKGQPGELCVLGPQVMAGYWQQPEQTDAVFLEPGWLKTGDICYMDEQGYLYLIDRKKDMILVSGFNVYPCEVEEVIAGHPGVAEVAVIGIPHEVSGEVVKAFIVKKDDSLTEEEIRGFCKQNLTGYKLPKEIEFCANLPKSNVGKILKRKLRNPNNL